MIIIPMYVWNLVRFKFLVKECKITNFSMGVGVHAPDPAWPLHAYTGTPPNKEFVLPLTWVYLSFISSSRMNLTEPHLHCSVQI